MRREPFPTPHPPADLEPALYVIAWLVRCGAMAVAVALLVVLSGGAA